MHALTQLIKEDMKPALGVTEPGAIAFAVSKARSYIDGDLKEVAVTLNSGMYKNAFTCGIPGSTHYGNLYAAALGVLYADPEKGLESLEGLPTSADEEARTLLDSGIVRVSLGEITSDIAIDATVRTEGGTATVNIRGSHTNIVKITRDDEILFEKEHEAGTTDESGDISLIHRYTLHELLEYVKTVPADEITFIQEAYRTNLHLLHVGLESDRTPYAHYLYEKNGKKIVSNDELTTAQLLCNGAIEARVLGLDAPAMSITGSGAHGIIATLPLYGVAAHRELPVEKLLRATALSYLVCTYIKEYSGRLSAFCGCAIAAGTGMACGLLFLEDAEEDAYERCIRNMASSITGMICDGGNHGCAMKGVVAVDAAFRSRDMALAGVAIEDIHGINGRTPEETMRNMGRIASPGMVKTEETILDIMTEK